MSLSAEGLLSALERCWDDGETGSHKIAAGRYIQWARWPEGMQVECSSDSFWEEGQLSFLQRRILAKLCFQPPTDTLPNYYRRTESRDELPAIAEALARCLGEVLDEPEPSAEDDQDADLGRALMHAFGRHGVYPYVPDWAIDGLQVTAETTFATFVIDPIVTYQFRPEWDQLGADGGQRFAVSHAGQGINSYAWTVRLERPGLVLMAQCGFGGAYSNEDKDRERLRRLFTLVGDVDQAVPAGHAHEIVVLLSDIRGVRSVGLADRTTALRDWQRAHEVDDVLAAVEAQLQGPPPVDPWEHLEQVFAHALRRCLSGHRSVQLMDHPWFQIQVTVGQDAEGLRIDLIPEERYGEEMDTPHLERALSRMGWKPSSRSRDLCIDVRTEEDLLSAARTLSNSSSYCWQLDPVETAREIEEVAAAPDES